MNIENDLLAVGHTAMDYIIQVDQFPHPNSSTAINDMKTQTPNKLNLAIPSRLCRNRLLTQPDYGIGYPIDRPVFQVPKTRRLKDHEREAICPQGGSTAGLDRERPRDRARRELNASTDTSIEPILIG